MKRNPNLLSALLVIMAFCQITAHAQDGDGRVSFFQDDIKKAQKLVDGYTSPKEKIYLVDEAGEQWLLRAVSKSSRAEWEKTTSMSPDQKKSIDDALDALAAAAAKKLPLYKPEDKRFAFQNQAEIALMKGKITNLSDLTIYKIGIADEVWRVVKDDSGLPKYRTKEGYVWFKNNNKIVDHPYCRIFQINVSENYEGGGTYGQSYAGYVTRWLCGCP